jgi:hypothetical protein
MYFKIASSNINLREFRECKALSLRKEKLFDQIMNKRIAGSSYLGDNSLIETSKEKDNDKNKSKSEIPVDSLNYYNSLVILK